MDHLSNQNCVVVFSTDDQYAQHTGVAICSLLENTKSPCSIEIYIIDFGVSKENKRKLNILTSRYRTPLHYINMDQRLLNNVQVIARKHISKAAFGKVMIPDLLDNSIKKVVFLDSDLIVLDDITKMYHTDISNHLLGAVATPFFTRYRELGLSSPYSYFNSGVLLLNLEGLRKFSASAKVLDFLVNHKDKIIGAEQDSLNAVFREQWYRLHLRWNLQTKFTRKKRLAEVGEFFGKAILDEALKRPALIHYASVSKPWHFTNIHPMRSYYYKYLKMTPWKNYVPPDKNLENAIKKQIKIWIGFRRFYTSY